MAKPTTDFNERVNKHYEKVKRILTGTEDIVRVIKEDHVPLKELIQIMKNSDETEEARVEAFKEFAPLLITHAKAEEMSLYDYMKTQGSELREHAFEGETEHMVADQLCEEIERSGDRHQILAKIKVLAESVEHHIREEENSILPDVEKEIDGQTLIALTQKYSDIQADLIAQGQDDSPHESDLEKPDSRH